MLFLVVRSSIVLYLYCTMVLWPDYLRPCQTHQETKRNCMKERTTGKEEQKRISPCVPISILCWSPRKGFPFVHFFSFYSSTPFHFFTWRALPVPSSTTRSIDSIRLCFGWDGEKGTYVTARDSLLYDAVLGKHASETPCHERLFTIYRKQHLCACICVCA